MDSKVLHMFLVSKSMIFLNWSLLKLILVLVFTFNKTITFLVPLGFLGTKVLIVQETGLKPELL